ncbi:hypothetical protein ABES02_28245 [Neobacillus pocheonensis]|uniref:hypothetical protein n=1 Tax=Neobacillus pocheonensis TaxID=363869 RepID=UPI003D29553B
MGMPVSSYSYFHAISQIYYKKHNPDLFDRLSPAYQNEMYALKRLTNKIFEPYNLFAFIIHDPAKHWDFAETLKEQFNSLHYQTGERLLFFALTQPPKQWKDETVQPKYYQHLQQVFKEENRLAAYPDQSGSHLFKDSFNVQAIAKTLNIPYDQLPAIVITTHPSIWSFKWYRTCAKHIRSQLRQLGSAANHLSEFKNQCAGPIEFQEKMFEIVKEDYDDDLNLCEGKGNELLTESLATALSELLSFLINQEDNYSKFNEMAESQIDIAMARVIEAIQLTKGKYAGEGGNQGYLETLDRLSEKVGTFLTLLQPSRRNREDKRIPGFELDSNQLINIGNHVGDFLKSYQNKYPDLDYTPAVICLAKAFEMEINKSIVHWIRRRNHIRLPDYYFKVQPDANGLVIPNMKIGEPIDFNKSRQNGAWQPPAMGQSYLVASKNIEKPDWTPFWEPAERKLLLREWDKIARVRNHAAHSEKVSSENMNDLLDSMKTLESNKIFKKMADLRESFRGFEVLPY